MNNLRITVLSPERRHLDDIQKTLQAAGDGVRTAAVEASLPQLAANAGQLAADILIVDCAAGDEEIDLSPLSGITSRHPALAVILLCNRQSPEFLLQAMRLGVREVLAAPADIFSLRAAIDRIKARTGSARAGGGRILAFSSCKGGSGGTFLASNLAHVLASEGAASVALIDLNLQFGDAHMLLTDADASHTLIDVVRNIHRLDAALLNASMTRLESGLAVLAATDDPSHGLEVRPEHIDALLALARSQFDYVILDVGRTVDRATVRALDHADQIYAVMQANLPCVHGARRLLNVFRGLEYPDRKVALVVNRYEKNDDLGIKAIEQALDRRIDRTVPNDYAAVAASINQGVPVVRMTASSPVSGALMSWREQLQGKAAPQGGGWIARMFRRA